MPPLGVLIYIRQARISSAWAGLAPGGGPHDSLKQCSSLTHPFSKPPPLDPVLKRCLTVTCMDPAQVKKSRFLLLAAWDAQATEAEQERVSWLQSLPKHSAALYGHSRFHGPLFKRMFDFMQALGYPDASLWHDVCIGMPTGQFLKPCGLWPLASTPVEPSGCWSAAFAFKRAPSLLRKWLATRGHCKGAATILERNRLECEAKRRQEVDWQSLKPGSYVVHPEFVVAQTGKDRVCTDCSSSGSGWGEATVSLEKLQLPSTDDVVDYGSRLHEAIPNCKPQLAVADEDSAYRNWPNSRPDAMMMALFLGQGRCRVWQDFAMCFGDVAAVYGYNRIRLFITVFCRVVFAIAAWSYYDDTALVDIKDLAHSSWYIFLKLHALLRIPIKGNPLDPASKPLAGQKFFPPAGKNKFLGEMVSIAAFPCQVAPTPDRLAKGKALLAHMRAERSLPSGDASSVFGKLRFLGSELHGRCGLPALQPFAARQSESSHDWTDVLDSASSWLLQLLEAVGPREWAWQSSVPPAIHIFGDASEPCSQAAGRPRLGAVMWNAASGETHTFELDIPASICVLFPGSRHIYYYELLWPVVACFIWRRELRSSYSIFYEDNEGAKFNLLSGFSSDWYSSLLLALFWGSSAVQVSRPWVARVASADNPADCLTKPGLDRSHLVSASATDASDIEEFWNFLFELLKGRHFPDWSAFHGMFSS